MENYNEKIEGKDRLHIPSTMYGYNLFDRKDRKILLYSKSKESCEDAKNILITLGFEDFISFKESIKDEEVVTNKILINKDENGDDIYSIPTLKDLYKVSLHILESRIRNGYFRKWDLPKNELDYTMEDVEKMPESFRKEAKSKLENNLSSIKSYNEHNYECDLAQKAIDTENGELALTIIRSRNGNEYEEFEIVTPTKL
jgi:hypothetical protein